MTIRQFLACTQSSSAGRRAEAAGALTRAFLYGNLDPDAAWEAKTAILALLDDPAPIVRRAMAEACAGSSRAPRPLVVALASDQTEVACLVLAASPVLTDADLVDAAAMGCEAVRATIAARHHLSHAVAGALAEIGTAGTLTVLARNPTAGITTGRLLRMVERHGGDASLREALLERADLPIEVRHAVGGRLARSLSDFVVGCGWLSPDRGARMSREAAERTVLDLCAGAGAGATGRVVKHLRTTGQLNAGLILRAILSGQVDFAEAAFSDLAGLDHARVAALLREPRGIAEVHRRAGLAEALLPAVAAALSAWREAVEGASTLRGAGLSRRMIERAITACEDMPFSEMQGVMALLSRYEAEAARDEARAVARAISEQALAREAARREADEIEAAWRAAQAAARAEPAAGATVAPQEPVVAQGQAPADPIQDGPDHIAIRPGDRIGAPMPIEAWTGTPVAAPVEAPLAEVAREIVEEVASPAAGIAAPGPARMDLVMEAVSQAVLAPVPDAAPEAVEAAPAPRTDPVGAILDALPDAILASFRAEREEQERQRFAAEWEAAEAALAAQGKPQPQRLAA